MSKTELIDLGADRLISIAADRLEEHAYIQTLKMLNKNAVLNGNDEDSYMLYAEAFDDMGLYEKCVNGWFKYIDYAGGDADLAEAYEGLAVSFMNMGQENFAAFYYNKLLMETEQQLTPENRREIIDSFLSKQPSPLKFAYPPKLVDYTETIESGLDFMRKNEFDKAIEEFDKVDKDNEKYLSARNFVAMCNVISDNEEQAEKECLNILNRDPDNVQALTTLAAVRSQQHRIEDSKELAYRLIALEPTDTDEIFKVATVACENRMHKEAYELFCKLDDRLAYDASLLFFKAISAYNCGKIEESLSTFDLMLTIYPNAVIADYWHGEVLKEIKKPEDRRRELEYFYRLPRVESEANIGILSAFGRLKDSVAQKLGEDMDVSTAIHWCFDEGDGSPSYELKLLGAMSAVKAGLEDTVRDLLLDAFLSDPIKMEILSVLAEKNEEGEYGIVVCNIFKRVTMVPLKLGKRKRQLFLRAYGMAFSRFAMLAQEYSFMLAAAAEKLYASLESRSMLDKCRSESVLAAAIIKYSEIDESGLTFKQICDFFGAKEEKVNALLD